MEVIVVASDVDNERCASEPRSGHRFALQIVCRRSLVNQATARNIGMGIARGEWLSFIDSDDEMLPERIAVLNDYTRANPALRLFLHGWDKGKGGGPLVRGEELYEVETRTRSEHDWVIGTVMHSQASIHRSVGVRFRTSDDMFGKEDPPDTSVVGF